MLHTRMAGFTYALSWWTLEDGSVSCIYLYWHGRITCIDSLILALKTDSPSFGHRIFFQYVSSELSNSIQCKRQIVVLDNKSIMIVSPQ